MENGLFIYVKLEQRTHCAEWNAVVLAGRVHILSDLVVDFGLGHAWQNLHRRKGEGKGYSPNATVLPSQSPRPWTKAAVVGGQGWDFFKITSSWNHHVSVSSQGIEEKAKPNPPPQICWFENDMGHFLFFSALSSSHILMCPRLTWDKNAKPVDAFRDYSWPCSSLSPWYAWLQPRLGQEWDSCPRPQKNGPKRAWGRV